ncbi:MAG: PD-(D/E)XK nuclease family protein [Alphaproteobacteria bacterium]|nr:PD-(D/E)XK nuclease family protein [Alphaproteobacteria bacterium]
MMKHKIFNIPASCSFADTLAELLIKQYENCLLELVDVLILMPNRRACLSLKEAFVRVRGLQPTMLPKILSIGDVEEEELQILGFNVSFQLNELSPAIDNFERDFLFTKYILEKSSSFGLERLSLPQAFFLSQELSKMIDTVNFEGLSFDNLKNLVPEEYASHWLETLSFMEIITHDWPKILKERGLVDASSRYNQLLEIQQEIWQKSKTTQRIIVAGNVANFPAVQNLIKTVLELPNGELYLNGLDKFLDEKSWQELDETHPEKEVKTLLDFLEVQRSDVQDVAKANNEQREILISEMMRPAKTTDKWREVKNKNLSHLAWRGIKEIECEDSRVEATVVAMLMREVLETPEKTAALVTTDRNLARRVSNELEKWDVKVDDSAGKPVHLTPIGIFLRQIVKTCEPTATNVDLLGLLKNPYVSLGLETASVRKAVREYEQKVLRADKPACSEEVSELISLLEEKLSKLKSILNLGSVSLKELIACHLEVAVSLSATKDKDGNQALWRGDDGAALAKFFASFYEKADVLETVEAKEYLDFFEVLLSRITVRTNYGTHPRLKILGPIEARFNSFDVIIIGGGNEGIWPKLSSADPWMSRPMKKDFGFPLPEKQIGILAKDFASLLAREEVYLTRADRVEGTPMIKSRWLMRLETVISALGIKLQEIEEKSYPYWVKKFDDLKSIDKISAPEPKPSLELRPRKLSMSAIETLMKDPYIVFAKYILKLKPLNELEIDLTAADYGSIIHGILDKFNQKFPKAYPQNAKEELLKIGSAFFDENEIALETKVFWWPKFEKTVEWLVEVETKYRQDIAQIYSEIEGTFSLNAPAGEFIITAKADRVDVSKNGKVNIIDYKTGKAKSEKEVWSGYAPQLPIEALIAQAGGFKEIGKKEVQELIYWSLARKEDVFDKEIQALLQSNLEKIHQLVSVFDDVETPYMAKPHHKYATQNNDYEHLARTKEWSVGGEGDD